ncbi:MAG: Glu/Leu/Phe/Val dehydrogenase dimerization domain-containing protein [Myxococcota bacterium]|nr:Glu/Leu/Phe/Val dehydrogenase dimerization domain-containing protein [Myxococcota bacterium]
MFESFDTAPQIVHIDRPELGLTAFIVIDQPSFEISAGGVRTKTYPSNAAALDDAKALARAMTIKCALGGLPVGGAKAVVKLHAGLHREKAFIYLGEVVESLAGRFRTAGDLGTFEHDLQLMATRTDFVHTNEQALGRSVALGLLACVESVRSEIFADGPAVLRVSVQGAGAIGSSVAKELSANGYKVIVSDLDETKALATGHSVLPACESLCAEVDILSPCAIGGVISDSTWSKLRSKLICGAANNIVSSLDVHWHLHRKGAVFIPDVVSSAGAVVDGIGESVLGMSDRTSLILKLGETAKQVFQISQKNDEPPHLAALGLAASRIASRN